MPDFRHVSPGEPMRRDAATENAMRDAARAYQQSGQRLGSETLRGEVNSGVVLVRNDSGDDVPRFGILGIDSPIVTPTDSMAEFKSRVMLSGVVPIDSHAVRFGVTLEPLKDKQISRNVVVSGVVQCQINVTNAAHTLAKANSPDVDKLVSDATTGVPILWKQTGTGTKWAIIRIDAIGGSGGSPVVHACDCSPFDCVPGGAVNLPSLGSGSCSYPTKYIAELSCLDCCDGDAGGTHTLTFDEPTKTWISTDFFCPKSGTAGAVCDGECTWTWTSPTCGGPCGFTCVSEDCGSCIFTLEEGVCSGDCTYESVALGGGFFGWGSPIIIACSCNSGGTCCCPDQLAISCPSPTGLGETCVQNCGSYPTIGYSCTCGNFDVIINCTGACSCTNPLLIPGTFPCGGPDSSWTQDAFCDDPSCTCPEPALPCANGETSTTDCTGNVHWETADACADVSCDCIAPDFDGTMPDETAQTACSGTPTPGTATNCESIDCEIFAATATFTDGGSCGGDSTWEPFDNGGTLDWQLTDNTCDEGCFATKPATPPGDITDPPVTSTCGVWEWIENCPGGCSNPDRPMTPAKADDTQDVACERTKYKSHWVLDPVSKTLTLMIDGAASQIVYSTDENWRALCANELLMNSDCCARILDCTNGPREACVRVTWSHVALPCISPCTTVEFPENLRVHLNSSSLFPVHGFGNSNEFACDSVSVVMRTQSGWKTLPMTSSGAGTVTWDLSEGDDCTPNSPTPACTTIQVLAQCEHDVDGNPQIRLTFHFFSAYQQSDPSAFINNGVFPYWRKIIPLTPDADGKCVMDFSDLTLDVVPGSIFDYFDCDFADPGYPTAACFMCTGYPQTVRISDQ